MYCSVNKSCLTLCDPWIAACWASLSFTISQSLLKLISIGSIIPSNHLILHCPLLLLPSIFPSIRVFSNESALPIWWPNYWSFDFSSSPSSEYSGLTSLRIDFLISLQSKGLSRVFSNTTVGKHQFFSTHSCGPTLTSILTTGNTIVLTIWTLISKVVPLFFSMFSRLVIAFLPRNKSL